MRRMCPYGEGPGLWHCEVAQHEPTGNRGHGHTCLDGAEQEQHGATITAAADDRRSG